MRITPGTLLLKIALVIAITVVYNPIPSQANIAYQDEDFGLALHRPGKPRSSVRASAAELAAKNNAKLSEIAMRQEIELSSSGGAQTEAASSTLAPASIFQQGSDLATDVRGLGQPLNGPPVLTPLIDRSKEPNQNDLVHTEVERAATRSIWNHVLNFTEAATRYIFDVLTSIKLYAGTFWNRFVSSISAIQYNPSMAYSAWMKYTKSDYSQGYIEFGPDFYSAGSGNVSWSRSGTLTGMMHETFHVIGSDLDWAYYCNIGPKEANRDVSNEYNTDIRALTMVNYMALNGGWRYIYGEKDYTFIDKAVAYSNLLSADGKTYSKTYYGFGTASWMVGNPDYTVRYYIPEWVKWNGTGYLYYLDKSLALSNGIYTLLRQNYSVAGDPLDTDDDIYTGQTEFNIIFHGESHWNSKETFYNKDNIVTSEIEYTYDFTRPLVEKSTSYSDGSMRTSWNTDYLTGKTVTTYINGIFAYQKEYAWSNSKYTILHVNETVIKDGIEIKYDGSGIKIQETILSGDLAGRVTVYRTDGSKTVTFEPANIFRSVEYDAAGKEKLVIYKTGDKYQYTRQDELHYYVVMTGSDGYYRYTQYFKSVDSGGSFITRANYTFVSGDIKTTCNSDGIKIKEEYISGAVAGRYTDYRTDGTKTITYGPTSTTYKWLTYDARGRLTSFQYIPTYGSGYLGISVYADDNHYVTTLYNPSEPAVKCKEITYEKVGGYARTTLIDYPKTGQRYVYNYSSDGTTCERLYYKDGVLFYKQSYSSDAKWALTLQHVVRDSTGKITAGAVETRGDIVTTYNIEGIKIKEEYVTGSLVGRIIDYRTDGTKTITYGPTSTTYKWLVYDARGRLTSFQYIPTYGSGYLGISVYADDNHYVTTLYNPSEPAVKCKEITYEKVGGYARTTLIDCPKTSQRYVYNYSSDGTSCERLYYKDGVLFYKQSYSSDAKWALTLQHVVRDSTGKITAGAVETRGDIVTTYNIEGIKIKEEYISGAVAGRITTYRTNGTSRIDFEPANTEFIYVEYLADGKYLEIMYKTTASVNAGYLLRYAWSASKTTYTISYLKATTGSPLKTKEETYEVTSAFNRITSLVIYSNGVAKINTTFTWTSDLEGTMTMYMSGQLVQSRDVKYVLENGVWKWVTVEPALVVNGPILIL